MVLVEPNIDRLPNEYTNKNIRLCNLESGINDSDVIVALVGHSQFSHISKESLEGKHVFDSIGLFYKLD